MKQKVGILIIMFLVLGSSSAVAARTPIADVENDGDRLVFSPLVPFERLVLTVTGPCAYEYQRAVTEGDVSFRLNDTTIDGVYTYQLVRTEEIDGDVIEALLQARAHNDEETPKALCREGRLPGPPLVQSEGFLVVEGEIIYDPEAHEKTATDQDRSGAGDAVATGRIPTKDHLIYDDLIVGGSACIGWDCADGESFGFDTLRLKEHKLRIKFEDTSSSASYPRNDWQLTANDAGNGGQEKFSIDDVTNELTPFTVEADAPDHALYVDDYGRIGSRTSTPSVELHTVDGDTPTLRLQQDGNSGFAAQTWDLAGNETNFFIRDATNGSKMPFRIQPSAPSSTLSIRSSGYVGVGTWYPLDKLHVEAGGADLPGIRIVNTDVDDEGWAFRVVDADEFRISKQGGSGAAFKLDADGNLIIQGTLTVREDQGDETTYPDYVFAPGYPLMPLADLGAFVEENRHLPRIPPASELARHGLNMTEMQIKLLEKVEELTLYVLALEKTNAGLEARLAALEQGPADE